MELLATSAQIITAVSIIIVRVSRFDKIIKEFKHYGLSDLVRNMVGATKIALVTLLITGIWYDDLVAYPALIWPS